MARDRYHGRRSALSEPLTNVEVSTHSTADFSLENVSRCLGINANGTLKIDTLDGQLGISILVFTGWNSLRIKKIYKDGSDAGLKVDCWD